MSPSSQWHNLYVCGWFPDNICFCVLPSLMKFLFILPAFLWLTFNMLCFLIFFCFCFRLWKNGWVASVQKIKAFICNLYFMGPNWSFNAASPCLHPPREDLTQNISIKASWPNLIKLVSSCILISFGFNDIVFECSFFGRIFSNRAQL